MHPLGTGILPRSLAALYGAGVGLRNRAYDRFPGLTAHVNHPVISIGGIHAGGVGKTPLAALTGALAAEKGFTVAYLSRGYGRREHAMVIVEPGESASWERVGDEPALLHRRLPQSWLGIGPDRVAAARALESRLTGRAVYILDDGFQHRRIGRDLDIVCLPVCDLDSHVLPAGTLREPFSGIRRADLVCLIGTSQEQPELHAMALRLSARIDCPAIATLHQVPDGWFTLAGEEVGPEHLGGSPTVLSGIARPERFLSLAGRLGVKPGRVVTLRDHQVFSPSLMENLRKNGQTILTTEKDALRLFHFGLVDTSGICYLRIRLSFADRASERLFVTTISARISMVS